MKTKEERIKKNRIIAIVFLCAGILMASFMIIQNQITKKADNSAADGVTEAGTYKIDLEGNIEYKITDKSEKDDPVVVESLRNADIKLPTDFYRFLSAKETAFTETIHYLRDDKLENGAYDYECEKVDEGCYILRKGEEDKCGLTDGRGNWIVEPEYGTISSTYYEEYGYLQLYLHYSGGPSAFVDRNGNWIMEKEKYYNRLHIYQKESLIVFKDFTSDGEHYGLCDIDGNVVFEVTGEEVNVLKVGNTEYYQVLDPDGKVRLLDRNGNDVVGGENRSVNAYNDCLIVRDQEGRYFICDEKGQQLTPHEYDSLDGIDCDDAGLLIAEKEGKKGIIDTKGNTVLEIGYDDILDIEPAGNVDVPSDKRAFLVKTEDGKVGIYNVKEGFTIEPQDETAINGDSYYHYDYDNEVLFFYCDHLKCVVLRPDHEPLYVECNDIYVGAKGVFVVEDYYSGIRTYTLLDLDGNKIYAEQADNVDVTYIDDKLCILVTKPEKQGGGYKIVYDGKVTFECAKDNIKIDDENTHVAYAVCDDNGKYGLINAKGELVLDYQYDDIEVEYAVIYKHDLYYIVKDAGEKYGVMDADLKWIYEPQFDHVEPKYNGLAVTLEKGQEIVK